MSLISAWSDICVDFEGKGRDFLFVTLSHE